MKALQNMQPLSAPYRAQIPAVRMGINIIAGHWIGQIPIHARREEQLKWVAVIEGWLTRCCDLTDDELAPVRAMIRQKLG